MASIYGAELVVELREPTDWERRTSCMGCAAPATHAVLDIGSKRGSMTNISATRLCNECTRKVGEAMREICTQHGVHYETELCGECRVAQGIPEDMD